MLPFFRGTSFEKGVDAAFESTVTGEAYLFRGSDYALINYDKEEVIAIRPITDGFHCLCGTQSSLKETWMLPLPRVEILRYVSNMCLSSATVGLIIIWKVTCWSRTLVTWPNI
jgi:hypothetical protein